MFAATSYSNTLDRFLDYNSLYVLKGKSGNMNNIFSKSPETYEILSNQLKMLLDEQRHQRADLATIKRQLHTIINSANLQKQVDQYFEETSPQTDQDEHDINDH